VPLDCAGAERLYELAARSGAASGAVHAAHALKSASEALVGAAPAVALQLTPDAVFGLNLAARLGVSARQSISRRSRGGAT
jgi:hypothetical protein